MEEFADEGEVPIDGVDYSLLEREEIESTGINDLLEHDASATKASEGHLREMNNQLRD
jgi:hypothetical protein